MSNLPPEEMTATSPAVTVESVIYREALVRLARDMGNMQMTEEAALLAIEVAQIARDALARGVAVRSAEPDSYGLVVAERDELRKTVAELTTRLAEVKRKAPTFDW